MLAWWVLAAEAADGSAWSGARVGLGAAVGEVGGALIGGTAGYVGVVLGPRPDCALDAPDCGPDAELAVVVGGSIGLGLGAVGGAATGAALLDRRLPVPVLVTAATAATGGAIALAGTGDWNGVGLGVLVLGTPIAAGIAGALTPVRSGVAVLPDGRGFRIVGAF